MTSRLQVLAPGLALFLFGCGAAASDGDERAAVRDADVAFSRAAERRDLDAFLALVSDSASFYTPSGRVLHGKAEVGEAWKPFFETGGPSLRWEPTDARAAHSGEIGYTTGRSWYADSDGSGRSTGKYVTIWRKESDGQWRAVVDIGVTDAPASPATAETPAGSDASGSPADTTR